MFVLLIFAHIARVIEEGAYPVHEPVFLVATAVALIMTVWAGLLLFAKRGVR